MTTINVPAEAAVLQSVLEEYGSRISINSSSRILTSSTDLAIAVANATASARTPYGPTITIASRSAEHSSKEDASKVPGGHADVKTVTELKMDHYTHAVYSVGAEDPKIILHGLKFMIYGMAPKAIAIVISLKQRTGEKAGAEGEGVSEGKTSYTVQLEDRIKYQSRGKAESLADVVEYAGFERGKIRSIDREVEVGGDKIEAAVVLAQAWDQLTA